NPTTAKRTIQGSTPTHRWTAFSLRSTRGEDMERITSVVWAGCSSSLATVAFASPTLSSGLEQLKRRQSGIEPCRGNIKPATVPRIAILFAIASMFAMPLCSSLVADDDHNPIGVTGAFEGVTRTAGAYHVLNHSPTMPIG